MRFSTSTLGANYHFQPKSVVGSNHLGNVITVVSDRKIGVSTNGTTVDYFSPDIVSANDFYAFGGIMNGRSFNSNASRYGFNGKEKDDEVKGEGNSLDFDARILDTRLGRWLSIDPLAKKYPMHSPYNYCAGNPILFVDIDGRDWFVNNKTGDVLYIKNASQVTPDAFKKLGINDNPNDYERLGANDMFGDKVSKNQISRDAFFVDNSESWMNNKGYAKAEKVKILETEFVSGGAMGGEERITQTVSDLKQIGDAKITYVKPTELNKKEVLKKEQDAGRYSSIRSVLYKLTKPFKQDNRETAEFYSNKSQDVGKEATFVDKVIHVIKAVIKGKK